LINAAVVNDGLLEILNLNYRNKVPGWKTTPPRKTNGPDRSKLAGGKERVQQHQHCPPAKHLEDMNPNYYEEPQKDVA
jgi:hypothetical protein